LGVIGELYLTAPQEHICFRIVKERSQVGSENPTITVVEFGHRGHRAYWIGVQCHGLERGGWFCLSLCEYGSEGEKPPGPVSKGESSMWL
jgi:hypothetical protein